MLKTILVVVNCFLGGWEKNVEDQFCFVKMSLIFYLCVLVWTVRAGIILNTKFHPKIRLKTEKCQPVINFLHKKFKFLLLLSPENY